MEKQLADLLAEAKGKFDPVYFRKSTRIEKKSALTKFFPDADFTDEVVDSSDSKYGKYSLAKLIKVVQYLWGARCRLSTGIALAKNTVKLGTGTSKESFCYDSLELFKTDSLDFLNSLAPDSKLVTSTYSYKEYLPYGNGAISYEVTDETKASAEDIELYKVFRRDIAGSLEKLSSDLDNAEHDIQIAPQYVPDVPFYITFDDFYDRFDAILAGIDKNNHEITVTSADIEGKNLEDFN